MALTFEVQEVRVSPGEAARFPFVLRCDTSREVTYTFELRHDDGLDSSRWDVAGGRRLHVMQEEHTSLVMEVPEHGIPAGEYRIWLTAIPDKGSASTADSVLVVEPRSHRPLPHLRILGAPKVRLNPDGSISISLSILQDGDSGLDVSVDIRHKNGWAFEIGKPQLHLGTQVGPFDVDITVHPPAGKSAQPGDEITIDLGFQGQTLASATGRIEMGAPPPRPGPPSSYMETMPRRRKRWAWLLGGALLALGAAGAIGFGASRHGSEPPHPPPPPPTTFSLSVQVSGGGGVVSKPGGIDCPGSCTDRILSGRSVTLVATPATGWAFLGWDAASCSGTGACTLTVSTDQTIAARFVVVHTLTVSVANGANVSMTVTGSTATSSCSGGSRCSFPVPDRAQATLTGTPPSATGAFTPVWTGCTSSQGFSCTIVMTGDQFAQFSYRAILR